MMNLVIAFLLSPTFMDGKVMLNKGWCNTFETLDRSDFFTILQCCHFFQNPTIFQIKVCYRKISESLIVNFFNSFISPIFEQKVPSYAKI
jgi:hypothetical protein